MGETVRSLKAVLLPRLRELNRLIFETAART